MKKIDLIIGIITIATLGTDMDNTQTGDYVRIGLKQMSELKIKCLNMPQLRTYVKFQCFTPSLPFL